MILERWPSGLRRTPGKCVGSKGSRRFKSCPLRQLFRSGCYGPVSTALTKIAVQNSLYLHFIIICDIIRKVLPLRMVAGDFMHIQEKRPAQLTEEFLLWRDINRTIQSKANSYARPELPASAVGLIALGGTFYHDWQLKLTGHLSASGEELFSEFGLVLATQKAPKKVQSYTIANPLHEPNTVLQHSPFTTSVSVEQIQRLRGVLSVCTWNETNTQNYANQIQDAYQLIGSTPTSVTLPLS